MQSPTLVRVLLVLLLALPTLACGDDEPSGLGPPQGLTITLNPDALTLIAGASMPIEAVVRDDTGRLVTGASVNWASSDEVIAIVGRAGTVQGLTVGQATITASVAGGETVASATANITVVEAPH